MAIYEPNTGWLMEQLKSIDRQTYPNINIYAIDDCSCSVEYSKIEDCFKECIKNFSYKLSRNEKNLGSNSTFEKLTEIADGEFYAYCDQDDIWLPHKIVSLYEAIGLKNSAMAYCSVSVIDHTGKLKAKTLSELYPRFKCIEGAGLSECYFFRNCSLGCASLYHGSVAKKALPFPKHTVYDHWLAIIASGEGKVVWVKEPFVYHRIHNGNQTGVLTGITDKASYTKLRIEPLKERLEFYIRYFSPSDRFISFVNARINGTLYKIWEGKEYCIYDALFEIAMRFLPDLVFKKIVEKLR